MKENLLSESLPPTDEHSKRQEKYLLLKNLVQQHPYWSVILLVIYAIIILQGTRLAVFLIDLSPHKVPYVPGSMVLEAVLALLWVVVPLYVLDWWRKPGFQMILTWPLRIGDHKALFRGLFFLVCLLPLFLLTFSTTIHQTALPTVVMVAVFCLFVGLAEEGLFRGLILNMLLPKGIWRAVLLSSLLFSFMHIFNVFVGFPLNAAVIQMLLALGFGMFLAAVRLRTNSLRSGIIAHALWDLPLIILNIHRQHISSPSLLLALLGGGIVCLIYLVCTLIVLRPKKIRELRAKYSFIPVPQDSHI